MKPATLSPRRHSEEPEQHTAAKRRRPGENGGPWPGSRSRGRGEEPPVSRTGQPPRPPRPPRPPQGQSRSRRHAGASWGRRRARAVRLAHAGCVNAIGGGETPDPRCAREAGWPLGPQSLAAALTKQKQGRRPPPPRLAPPRPAHRPAGPRASRPSRPFFLVHPARCAPALGACAGFPGPWLPRAPSPGGTRVPSPAGEPLKQMRPVARAVGAVRGAAAGKQTRAGAARRPAAGDANCRYLANAGRAALSYYF